MEGGSEHYGSRVWGSAYVLAEHLQRLAGLKGARVVELGAGPGLVGLVAAALGANVVLTDHVVAVLELLRNNTARNEAVTRAAAGSVQVMPLKWNHQPHVEGILAQGPVDYILAADVL